ncbi:MAG: hypothetical protein J1D87_03725 [Lachnospiraceae bacterium]|nr:hypothetical protein [Lachnospiraceae bacterium]
MSTEESIIQNLKDAGCSKSQIEECMDYVGKNERNGVLKLLRQHRDVLLDGLHEKQRMIECLDYLVYQIKKDNMKFEEESVK